MNKSFVLILSVKNVIDLESGKVRGYNNDYADLEEIAENFSELVLDLVEQVESFS